MHVRTVPDAAKPLVGARKSAILAEEGATSIGDVLCATHPATPLVGAVCAFLQETWKKLQTGQCTGIHELRL